MMVERIEIDFEKLFDIIPSAVLLLDSVGNLLALNRSARSQFRLTSEALTGIKLFHFQPHSKDQKEVSPEVMQFLRDAENPVETIFQRSDGGHFPGVLRARVYNQDSEAEMFVMVIDNVTEQKMKEGSRIRDKLAADKSNEAKSDFLSSMSHEIRTPIQGTLGALDLLGQTNLCDQQLHYLNLAKNSSSSLLDIVNDVLDVASLEANAMRLNCVEVDLYQLLDEVYGIYRVYAYEKNSDITLKIDSSVPRRIKTDPIRLRQILCNYISNGIKYSEEGEIHINVRIIRKTILRFEVNDDGPGVEREIESNLFSQHVVGKNVNHKYGSYGIGLSICKKLASLMEGEVGYRRLSPRGSCFWFNMRVHVVGGPTNDCFKKGTKQAVIYSDEPIKAMLEHQLSEWSINIRNSGTTFIAPEEVVKLFDADKEKLLIFDSNSYTKARLLKYINSLIVLFNKSETHGQPVLILIFGLPPAEIGSVKPGKLDVVATTDAYSLMLLAKCCSGLAKEVDPEKINTSSTAEVRSVSLQGSHILIAEDSVTNLEIFALQLEGAGAKVARAKDGLEAFNYLEKSTLDIALLDLQMPKMDGFEVLSKLMSAKENAFHANPIPIIAMSANVIGDIRQKCLAAGFSDYLSKPIERDSFLSYVASKVPHKKGRRKDDVVVPVRLVKEEASSSLPRLVTESTGTLIAPVEEEALVDFDFLKNQLCQVRPDAGMRMIELFIAEVTERGAVINEAIRVSNYETLKGEAHVLKSSCSSFGAVKMSRLASALEDESKDEKNDACQTICKEMESIFERTKMQLRAYLQAQNE